MIDHKKRVLRVSSNSCGLIKNNPVYLITMINGDVSIELTNLGGIITAIYAPDRNGIQKNVVAGFGNMEDYNRNPHYYGCLLGRYAGRISGAKFNLNGKSIQLTANDGDNHLHGGAEGFDKKIWKVKSFVRTEGQVGVIMEYLSEDGEEGYPGNLWVTVKYILNHSNELKISYEAQTDKSTPVNLSNHTYFNLSGFEQPTILAHDLRLNAFSYTEKNNLNIPTGAILPLKGTPLDFSIVKSIGDDIEEISEEAGYNHNYVLSNHLPGKIKLAAVLSEERAGRVLKVFTDQPGIQVYTANDWNNSIWGSQGYRYHKYGAVALETQNFSDAPNHPEFPDSILHPGQLYLTTTIYQFTTDSAS